LLICWVPLYLIRQCDRTPGPPTRRSCRCCRRQRRATRPFTCPK
jgi:hypothetical protein